MKIQPLTESENETEEEIEIANTAARRVVKLLQMFDNEPYESDNEYLDESYKDIDYRRNDQSKAFSDLSELLETES
jgi:hypothetical protein